MSLAIAQPRSKRPEPAPVPRLEQGDHLTREEFERRYEQCPDIKKAELIEGIVYMPPPVSFDDHAEPDFDLAVWLGVYKASTPGLKGALNCTVRMDDLNEPQPDSLLFIQPEYGGQLRRSGGFLVGAPEFICEISASSASYDLHSKKRAYERNGVREYVVVLPRESRVVWFHLQDGKYAEISPDADGIYRSREFPGLWLDPEAALADDTARVLQVLQQGLASPEHAAFVAEMEKRKK